MYPIALRQPNDQQYGDNNYDDKTNTCAGQKQIYRWMMAAGCTTAIADRQPFGSCVCKLLSMY
jgi:hypothetical protein